MTKVYGPERSPRSQDIHDANSPKTRAERIRDGVYERIGKLLTDRIGKVPALKAALINAGIDPNNAHFEITSIEYFSPYVTDENGRLLPIGKAIDKSFKALSDWRTGEAYKSIYVVENNGKRTRLEHSFDQYAGSKEKAISYLNEVVLFHLYQIVGLKEKP